MRRISTLAIILATAACLHAFAPATSPKPPTNAIFTWSPLFGNNYTVRAAWSDPVSWNDNGPANRQFLCQCVIRSTGVVVHQETVNYGQYVIQFQVPQLNTKYVFKVWAINGLGNQSKQYDSYQLYVP